MTCLLNSDNLGNRIKCIECIQGINNEILSLTNIMEIIGILNDNKGFKQYICNYLLNKKNIDNNILGELYCFANKLNVKNTYANNNNENDNKIEHIFELNNDVLTRIVSMLDVQSILNFEITSRNGCYISRQPICLSNNLIYIHASWTDDQIPKYHQRFSKIQKAWLKYIKPPLNSNALDFLNNVAQNIVYLNNDVRAYNEIKIENFKSLKYLKEYDLDYERHEHPFMYASFIQKIYNIETLEIEMCIQETSECLEMLKMYNKSSLKSLVLNCDGGRNILFKLIQTSKSTLHHLCMNSKVFNNLITNAYHKNIKISLQHVTELTLIEKDSVSVVMDEEMIDKIKMCFQCCNVKKLFLDWLNQHIWLKCFNMNMYAKLKMFAVYVDMMNDEYTIQEMEILDILMNHIENIIQYKQKHQLWNKMVLSIHMVVRFVDWNCGKYIDFMNLIHEFNKTNINLLEIMLIIDTSYTYKKSNLYRELKWYKNQMKYNPRVTIYYENELKNEYKFLTLKNIDNYEYYGGISGIKFIAQND